MGVVVSYAVARMAEVRKVGYGAAITRSVCSSTDCERLAIEVFEAERFS